MKSWKTVLAVGIIVIIFSVSAYDSYRCVTDAYFLHMVEGNPVAVWLLSRDGGKVSLLLAAKTIGTGFVGAAVGWMLASKKWSWLWPALTALLLVQLFVVYRYIMMGT